MLDQNLLNLLDLVLMELSDKDNRYFYDIESNGCCILKCECRTGIIILDFFKTNNSLCKFLVMHL